MHQVFALLREVSAYCTNKDVLEAGKILTEEKRNLVIKLMGDDISWMREGALENTIFQHEKAPESCYIFKK